MSIPWQLPQSPRLCQWSWSVPSFGTSAQFFQPLAKVILLLDLNLMLVVVNIAKWPLSVSHPILIRLLEHSGCVWHHIGLLNKPYCLLWIQWQLCLACESIVWHLVLFLQLKMVLQYTVTPKTLYILTPNVVWEVHHFTVWEFHLALVELYIVHTLGYKITPWVMWFGQQGVEIWSI